MAETGWCGGVLHYSPLVIVVSERLVLAVLVWTAQLSRGSNSADHLLFVRVVGQKYPERKRLVGRVQQRRAERWAVFRFWVLKHLGRHVEGCMRMLEASAGEYWLRSLSVEQEVSMPVP